ncbi:MAG: endolytic transglycosylase MltG [Oscillospiraceae bacterium]|nr:endolytic transglycosylase MltG [Oscillospiraceae bacterium]
MDDNLIISSDSSDSDVPEVTKPEFKMKIDDYDEFPEHIPEESKAKVKIKKTKKDRGVVGGIILAVSVLAVSALLSWLVWSGLDDVLGMTRSERIVIVEIPPSSTVRDIARILKDEEIIKYEWLFRMVSKMREADMNYHPGRFDLNPGMAYDEMIDKMQQAGQDSSFIVEVTLIEGETLREFAVKLRESGVIGNIDEFLDIINKENFGFEFENEITNPTWKYNRKEGFAFPDTYKFYKNESLRSVAHRFLENFDKKVTADMRNRAAELDLTLEELVILASIIQGEANNPTDMAMVSGVFHNRLNNASQFPRFESCVTRDYCTDQIKPFVDNQEYDKYIMAYNTYNFDGFPVGAVNNPGLDAINAALNPTESEFFFFYSDSVGKIYYAKTLREHEENQRRYK